MKIAVLDEPQLEFGGGSRHIDPRSGITNYGPADAADTKVRTIRAAIVGTQEAIEGVRGWLDRCREPIAAKLSHLSHYYVPFPGFDTSVGYRSTIVINSRLERRINRRALNEIVGLKPAEAIQRAVDLYDAELAALDEEPQCDVVIVCKPEALPERGEPIEDPERPWKESKPAPLGFDFHELLKARSLRTTRPIQIVKRETWDLTYKPEDRDDRRPQQDEATKAWNLHTALYYKAGGVPWRMTRDNKDLTNCFVGVSFYRSIDGQSLQTSVAQVFNERGDGVIVRGAQATASRDDRQPHLTADDAKDLLEGSLARYRSELVCLTRRALAGGGEGALARALAGLGHRVVFAVAGEEFGVFLCVLIVALFAFLVLRALTKAMRKAGYPKLRKAPQKAADAPMPGQAGLPFGDAPETPESAS